MAALLHVVITLLDGYSLEYRIELKLFVVYLIVHNYDSVLATVGTVAAFLAFGAMLAAYCEQKDGLGAEAVEGIKESVTKYFDYHLRSWLRTNGGLVSLIKGSWV